jgi:hypothetical protein
MAQFGDWPDMAVNVNIVIIPVIASSDSQLVAAEWSSRYDLPIPVPEGTVELIVRPTEPTQPDTFQVRPIYCHQTQMNHRMMTMCMMKSDTKDT